MKIPKKVTNLFLVRRNGNGEISEICLAMKKRRLGVGKWNGAGGKLEPGESFEEAAKRETREEIGVLVTSMRLVAEVEYRWQGPDPDSDQLSRVFFAEEWEGEPTESEEMRPQWFPVSEIPFDAMWPDARYWYPDLLSDKVLRARFEYSEEGDVIGVAVEETDIQ